MNNNDSRNYSNRIKPLQKYKICRSLSIVSVLSIALVLLLVVSFSIDKVFAQQHPFIATTRGSFDKTNGSMIHQANLPSALSILNSNSCPGELAIYVHGVWADEKQAKEQTDRVSLSLQDSGYNIPLIGFSWDSNTAFSFVDASISEGGWTIAKNIVMETVRYWENLLCISKTCAQMTNYD